MSYEEKIIPVNEIKLDQDNPRFPPVNSQREAIKVMIKDQGEKIVNLALDIYQNGINPSSRPILFKEGKKIIDGDGNRRLVAIKILETPSLADFIPKIRKKIDGILKMPGSFPTELNCVIFENRESARHWISINHGGQQGGRGQINWDAEQATRFESKTSIAMEALDLLSNQGLISEEDKEELNKSTLDRFLSYKDTKSRLCISKNGNHYSFGDINNLKNAVLHLRGKAVKKVYTADDGKEFLNAVMTSQEPETYENRQKNTSDSSDNSNTYGNNGRRSRRTQKPGLLVFGGKLSLQRCQANNLYLDIEFLYKIYLKNKDALSADFVVLFRMSLRILAETAAKEVKKDLDDYVNENFDQAKKTLNQDAKTSLSNQNVSKKNIVKLFHTGAHDYTNSRNEEQALAMSIILGAILRITHGKE